MYIRTKDSIYEVTKDTKGTKFIVMGKNKTLLDYGTFISSEADIIKQSETIEELCDEFVIVRNGETPTILINYDNLSLLKARVVKDNQKVYGAIWTDKGLIYVAKMNDEGELELI